MASRKLSQLDQTDYAGKYRVAPEGAAERSMSLVDQFKKRLGGIAPRTTKKKRRKKK